MQTLEKIGEEAVRITENGVRFVMQKSQDRPAEQIARLRAATSDAASTDNLTRVGAVLFAIAGGFAVVTTIRDVTGIGAFHTGVDCVLASLVMWALNRILRILKPIAEVLLHNHDLFGGRTEEIQAAASSTATAVNGVLSIIEQTRQAQNGDGGTGPHPIQIRR